MFQFPPRVDRGLRHYIMDGNRYYGLEDIKNDHRSENGVLFRLQDGPSWSSSIEVVICPIIRQSEKFYYIKNSADTLKRVGKNARRSYAYDSFKLAVNSYLCRKFKQIDHLRRAMQKAETYYHSANEEFEKLQK